MQSVGEPDDIIPNTPRRAKGRQCHVARTSVKREDWTNHGRPASFVPSASLNSLIYSLCLLDAEGRKPKDAELAGQRVTSILILILILIFILILILNPATVHPPALVFALHLPQTAKDSEHGDFKLRDDVGMEENREWHLRDLRVPVLVLKSRKPPSTP
ncbi:hypothetical protein K490DRAFT_54453 [Saccharata proteae CBS 121410]|uniref:Uncharacterized protein n=1 Tax=Saccharata proteae CBS 121410 TaxID=1314787 RepID=A0A9P4HZ07_9PEZI|nr:hypothetical protein K490DRAFT_54453 [Saccharata proteae CBS 121410]